MGKPFRRGENMTIQIFCDFDGTITETDNIVAIMKEFGPPQTEDIKNKVLSQDLSIRDGVSQMFQLLSTELKHDIIHFLQQKARIRAGFKEFIAFTQRYDLEFYVISGGMDFFVHPLLETSVSQEQIYCNATDFSGSHIRIDWVHACDKACENDCGLCKPSLLRRLGKKNALKIIIGDSITDLQAAKQADLVFARDFLLTKCNELEIPCIPFETFYDIQDYLLQRLGVQRQQPTT
jgi:2-hydroxy-3-keto-5-methylthiopentenyl-1-phosphate phosphatase